MTAITMNYVVNPLSEMWRRFVISFEITGYARAAGELTRLGYHKQAENCINQIKILRANR